MKKTRLVRVFLRAPGTGRGIGDEWPRPSRTQRTKRSTAASGRSSGGRKPGAKPRVGASAGWKTLRSTASALEFVEVSCLRGGYRNLPVVREALRAGAARNQGRRLGTAQARASGRTDVGQTTSAHAGWHRRKSLGWPCACPVMPACRSAESVSQGVCQLLRETVGISGQSQGTRR